MLLSNYKFLVVDKTAFACQLVQDTLFELGARQLDYSTSIEGAWNSINIGHSNFLICEHDLGKESGFDLIEKVRFHKVEEIKTMPIILLSATTDRASIFAGRDCGVDEIVAKPFTAAVLSGRIEAVVTKRRNFVEEQIYHGPDRRRRRNEYDGAERRGKAAER